MLFRSARNYLERRKALCTNIDNKITKAIITETEAYAGENDKASHAYGGRRTKRTEPLYQQGGRAYVYLCYGIHHLFNVVTNVAGVPHAVLIRAGKQLEGEPEMLRRREKAEAGRSFLLGPGSLAQALGITTSLTGTDLGGETIWIEDHGPTIDAQNIAASPRVGIGYAEEDIDRLYRFVLEG